jgi:hypothetical protein
MITVIIGVDVCILYTWARCQLRDLLVDAAANGYESDCRQHKYKGENYYCFHIALIVNVTADDSLSTSVNTFLTATIIVLRM